MTATTAPPVTPPSKILNETVIGFAAAGRKYPGQRSNRFIDPSTVFRWARSGVRLPGGRRLKLECVRLGGRWLTSLEALQRFADALTAASDPPSDSRVPPARRSRRPDPKAVNAELARRGY